jgi:hypothetical protein
MLKRLLLTVCLAVAFMSGRSYAQLSCSTCEIGATSEGEACGDAINDDCSSPVAVTCGTTVCGHLYTDISTGIQDVDWYMFDLPATANVTINYNFKSNAMVNVYNDCTGLPVASFFPSSCSADSFSGNLPAGVYYVEIMPMNDMLTCVDDPVYNWSLTCGAAVPCDLEAAILTTPSCPGSGLGGMLEVITVGGSGPFFYIWSTGDFDPMLMGVFDGTYTVTVIDANGCADTATTDLVSVCPTPDGVTVTDVQFYKATVSWIPNDCAQKYRVQIRAQGASTWTTYSVSGIFNSRVVKFLSPGTTYDYRVRTVCSPFDGSSISMWSPIQSFTTPGSCTSPTGIDATPSSTSAFVSWTAGTGVYAYRLRYREQGTSTWTPVWINGALTTKTINGLTANTTYEYQMRSQCDASATDFSPYIAIQTFTTMMRLGESDDATVGVYPNPNNGQFTLAFDMTTSDVVTLEVADMLGRVVYRQMVDAIAGNNALVIDANLAAGQYILKLEGNATTHVVRFNVQN